MKIYNIFILCFISITLIFAAFTTLHLRAFITLRDTPILKLTTAQQQIFTALEQPIIIEAYVRSNPAMRRAIENAVLPLQTYLENISIKWINPDSDPIKVSARNIGREGQLFIEYQQRGQRIDIVSPLNIANAILSLAQVSQKTNLVHLQGHGERALLSDRAGSWYGVADTLGAQMNLAVIDSTQQHDIPTNSDILLIADPRGDSLENDAKFLNYLQSGGNLIYSTDINHPYLPMALQKITNLNLIDGIIYDADATKYGLQDPLNLVIETLGDHPINYDIDSAPILFGAVGFKINEKYEKQQDINTKVLLLTSVNSWSEITNNDNNIKWDKNEQRGPIGVAWITTRKINDREQYIIVIGDSDLWQQRYVNAGGNKQWLQAIVNYVVAKKQLQLITAAPLKDQFIVISKRAELIIAFIMLLLFLLPISFAIIKRRQCKINIH